MRKRIISDELLHEYELSSSFRKYRSQNYEVTREVCVCNFNPLQRVEHSNSYDRYSVIYSTIGVSCVDQHHLHIYISYANYA